MSQMLDPVTQNHVRQAAESLADEFAGVFSQETIERYIAESVDLLGDSKINVFVPVLAHRFARERLKALAQTEGLIVEGDAGGALRLRPQRRAQPDGRGPREAPLARAASMSAPQAAIPARRSTRPWSRRCRRSASTWARSSRSR